MPTKTARIAFRLSPETDRQIAELAARWMGLTPPSRADVVAECVKRVHLEETKKERRRERL